MVRKGGRMTSIQIQMLVDILYENTEIASGKLSPTFTREDLSKKWEAVAILLNSKGLGPQKTAEQWRKSWTDLKCTIRNKAAKIELSGGTDLLNDRLTNLEKRVLQLAGDITPIVTSEGNEGTKLTGKLYMKKLEADLEKTESDLLRAMKKPNQIVLPVSFAKLAGIPEEHVMLPIIKSVGIKQETDEKAEDKNNYVNLNKDNSLNVSSDGSDEDISYADCDINEETFDESVGEPLSPPAKRKKASVDNAPSTSSEPRSFISESKKTSVNNSPIASSESKSYISEKKTTSSVNNSPTASSESGLVISAFQKQIESQTAVLREQTNVMKDIAKSLRLIANALLFPSESK